GRAKAAAQQAYAMQLLQPLAVHDIRLPTGDVLYVPSIHEDYIDASGLEDLVERDPIDPGRFHGHAGHAALCEPVGQAMEIAREGPERPDGGRVPVGGDGNVVRRGAAIG